MANWLQDLRYTLRQLRKSPGFAIAAVLTLAVAIGANAVVFAALDGLVLRPLNVPQAESLLQLGRAGTVGNESYPNYLDLRDRNHSFAGLAADAFAHDGVDTGDGAEGAWGFATSGNYFDVLGVQPYLGRVFHASDEHGPNSAPYIVLSYPYWQNHFHGDRNVLGRTVLLNKHPFTIIGVAQPGFLGTFNVFSPAFFVPIVNEWNDLTDRANRGIDAMFGNIKPGVTPAQAVADFNTIGADLEKTYPKMNGQMKFELGRLGLGSTVKGFLAALMLLAGLILLAACANLGSLFAARAADRSKEVALRLALGSTRKRVLRGLFTEATLVSLMGGGVGMWASVVLLRALRGWQPFPEWPINVPITPDTKVYLLALVLSLLSGFLFGAVPLRQVLRTDPYQTIKLGTVANGASRFTARDLLLATQIAICAVLVTSSLVAVRGLARSLHSKLGVDPNDAMLVSTDPTEAGYSENQVPVVQQRMIDAMRAIPGVTSVGMVGMYPPLHMGWDEVNVFADTTADLRPANAAAEVIKYSISPEYFQSAGTALLSGRNFTWHDDQNSPRVAVVNKEFARKVFGSAADAIGRYYKVSDGTRVQVVGVAEDGKYTANIAEAPQSAMFLPILQSPSNQSWMIVRSQGNPQQLSTVIRGALRQVDAGLPSFIQTWKTEMNGALFASRMAAMSLGVLGIMGAILSITGVFGMAAYSVSKRLRELGIRVALGAQKKEVLAVALGRAFRLLAFGSAAGLILAALASRVLAYIVYQATSRDPLVLTGVVAAMALLGLLATWIPARRALSVDPVILLREE
ncbi:MAG TPA: ABC transporter permease [Terriglobales bacterium]